MKLLTYAVLGIMLLSGNLYAQESEIKVDRISRTTLVVSSMDKAVHLFGDILGLKITDVTAISGEPISKQMGYDNSVNISFVGVSGGEGSSSLALMSFDNVEGAEREAHPSKLVAGSTVLVMSTQHIHEIYEKVKNAGYQIISAPGIPFPREGLKEQNYNMLFVGPGGVVIELSKPSVR